MCAILFYFILFGWKCDVRCLQQLALYKLLRLISVYCHVKSFDFVHIDDWSGFYHSYAFMECLLMLATVSNAVE